MKNSFLVALSLALLSPAFLSAQRGAPASPAQGKGMAVQATVKTANAAIAGGVATAQQTAQSNAQAAIAQVQKNVDQAQPQAKQSEDIDIYVVKKAKIKKILEKIQKTSPNSFFIDENGVTLRDKKEMQDAIATDIEVELQDDAAANKKAKDVDPKSVNLYRFFTVPGTSIKAYLNNPTQAGMTVTTAAQTANVAKTATKAAGGGNTGVTKPAATTIVKAQTASAGTSGAPAALGQFKVMTAASAAAAAATPAAPAKAPASKR